MPEGVGTLKFVKMQGTGNDYIYVNCFDIGEQYDWVRLAREISDRHFGVGSDGLILVMPSKSCDFRMRIFNADGSEGDMCGNGIRCFARLVYELGLTSKTEIDVETRAGVMRPALVIDRGAVRAVRVNMGRPSLFPGDVPMVAAGYEQAKDVPLVAGGRTYLVTGVRMGNPNGVVFVDDLKSVELVKEGPLLERHVAFPKRANIEFVEVLDPGHIDMLVWERGSGATLACGTGASACLVASAATGRASREAEVKLPGGRLFIEWSAGGDVFMTGPAESVCTGEFVKWKE
jgi:diaminopimelate epimerase